MNVQSKAIRQILSFSLLGMMSGCGTETGINDAEFKRYFSQRLETNTVVYESSLIDPQMTCAELLFDEKRKKAFLARPIPVTPPGRADGFTPEGWSNELNTALLMSVNDCIGTLTMAIGKNKKSVSAEDVTGDVAHKQARRLGLVDE